MSTIRAILSRENVFIALSVIEVILCCGLVATILMQSKKAAGFGGVVGGMGGGQTYWDKNKGRSFEGILEKYTKILATLYILAAIGIGIICK